MILIKIGILKTNIKINQVLKFLHRPSLQTVHAQKQYSIVC